MLAPSNSSNFSDSALGIGPIARVKLVGECDCRSNIFGRHLILSLDFLVGCSGGDFRENTGDRHAGAADDGLTMMNTRIDLDPIVHVSILTGEAAKTEMVL